MLEDEATIARERLVGAVPRQRDRHLLARQLADAVGRQRARVGEGLVETVGDPVDQREIGGGDGAGMVIGGKAFGDLPRVSGLEIGRATCRESGWPDVEISEAADS